MTQPSLTALLQAIEADPFTNVDPLSLHRRTPDFEALERRLAAAHPALAKVRYPEALRSLYAYELPPTDCIIVRFEASTRAGPLEALASLAFDRYQPSEIAGLGLLAVAEDGNDGGPICIDTRSKTEPDQWPLHLWDHDRQAIGPVLYSSADKLLACAAHVLAGGSVSDLSQVDPDGEAASYYGFMDD